MNAARTTRSGRTFSPYHLVPIFSAQGFDFPTLLRETYDFESKEQANYPTDGALGFDVPLAKTSTHLPTPAYCAPSVLPSSLAPLIASSPSGLSPLFSTGSGLLDQVHSATSRQHAKRRQRREREKQVNRHIPKARTHAKYVAGSQPLKTTFTTESLRAAKGAYSAIPAKQKAGDQKAWDLQSLLDEGISLVSWNGIDCRPIVDGEDRIIAVLVGRPSDPKYLQAAHNVYNTLIYEHHNAFDQQRNIKHQRGSFPVLNVGIFHGKGTLHPMAYINHEKAGLAARLVSNPDVRCLANFASSGFQLWAPNVYSYYKSHLDQLYTHPRFSTLPRLFPRSIFPTSAFNFGPNVWTYRHRDCLNCPFGWCSIQALGEFDSTVGGHLILWELGLAIEFPSGSCVLIPSATITHSNIPVQEGDSRASFTQYAPGGLFCYVDNNFRTENEFKVQDPAGYHEMCALKDTRWEAGLGLLSRWSDMKNTVRVWQGTQ